jgi:hypothetical protein
MVIGELEGGGFGDLTAALLQSQTSVQAGRPGMKAHPPRPGRRGWAAWLRDTTTDAGHGGPAPIHLGPSYKGARMRPKMPTHV